MSAVQKSNATDNADTLPGPYKIDTSNDGETVTISRSGSKSVSVKASSIEGIKNVLSKFWPYGNEKLTPATEMILLDQFSGNAVKLNLGSLSDVARIVDQILLSETSTSTPLSSDEPVKRGRGRPKKIIDAVAQPSPAKPADDGGNQTSQIAPSDSGVQQAPKRGRGRPPKQQQPVPVVSNVAVEEVSKEPMVSPPAPDVALVTEVPVKRGRGRPKKNVEPALVASPPATETPVKRGRGRPPKNTDSQQVSAEEPGVVLLGGAPSWFGATFLPKYEAHSQNGASWVLNKVPLKLQRPGSKMVEGIALKPEDVSGWGYQITSGGKHVAWVIVSGPSSLSIVSTDGANVIPQTSIAQVVDTLVQKAPAKAA